MVARASRHCEFWVQKRSVCFSRVSRCLLVIFSKYIQMSLLLHPELSTTVRIWQLQAQGLEEPSLVSRDLWTFKGIFFSLR